MSEQVRVTPRANRLYSAIEPYIIVPHVYGGHLCPSTLAVIVALSVGAALQGIIGAVLVLPLVAAYPILFSTFYLCWLLVFQ